MKNNIPRVGIGVIVIKNHQVLLGKRKNAHGDGTWSFPGGHLEFSESWEDCARRETMEETDIKIKNIRFGAVTNDIFQLEEKHYITIFILSEYDCGEVKVMEKEKCEKWEWFDWGDLPENLFVPIQNLLKKNYNPLS